MDAFLGRTLTVIGHGIEAINGDPVFPLIDQINILIALKGEIKGKPTANDQELSVSLLQQRTKLAIQVDYAVRHHDIIQKFGRFPHRNKHLGRVSTPEEEKFLTSGGESF